MHGPNMTSTVSGQENDSGGKLKHLLPTCWGPDWNSVLLHQGLRKKHNSHLNVIEGRNFRQTCEWAFSAKYITCKLALNT